MYEPAMCQALQGLIVVLTTIQQDGTCYYLWVTLKGTEA